MEPSIQRSGPLDRDNAQLARRASAWIWRLRIWEKYPSRRPGNCFRDTLTAHVHRYAAGLLIRPVDAAPCLPDHRHVRPFRFDYEVRRREADQMRTQWRACDKIGVGSR